MSERTGKKLPLLPEIIGMINKIVEANGDQEVNWSKFDNKQVLYRLCSILDEYYESGSNDYAPDTENECREWMEILICAYRVFKYQQLLVVMPQEGSNNDTDDLTVFDHYLLHIENVMLSIREKFPDCYTPTSGIDAELIRQIQNQN